MMRKWKCGETGVERKGRIENGDKRSSLEMLSTSQIYINGTDRAGEYVK
jgi:hypothetical protein